MGMDTMVKNMHDLTTAGVVDSVRMGSLTPAERVGFDHDIGSIEAGKRADVVLLSRELKVSEVYIGGVSLDAAPAAGSQVRSNP
jgi:N-acetylglucosamine-6-phosphate deacetylase